MSEPVFTVPAEFEWVEPSYEETIQVTGFPGFEVLGTFKVKPGEPVTFTVGDSADQSHVIDQTDLGAWMIEGRELVLPDRRVPLPDVIQTHRVEGKDAVSVTSKNGRRRGDNPKPYRMAGTRKPDGPD